MKPFRKSGPAPYSTAVAGVDDAVYHVAQKMPSDCTHVDKVWVGNLLGSGAPIGAAGITSNISVHADDGTGTPTGPAFATWLGQTIPGDGFWQSPSGFNVVLPANRRIVVSYSVPGGSLLALSPITPWGAYSISTTTVDPPPAITGGTPNAVFWVMVDGQTDKDIANVFGDSIIAGSGGGVEGRAWDQVEVDLDVCVCVWGVPGSKLSDWKSGTYLPYSYVLWNDGAWVLEPGVNDLGPSNAAQMIIDRDVCITYIRSKTTGRGYINTIGPQASYSDPGQANRLAYNADTRTLGTADGIYAIYDRAAKQSDGGLADNADTTILYAAYSYDGIHLLNAGQDQEAAGWEAIVDLTPLVTAGAFARVLATLRRLSPSWPSTDPNTDVGRELGSIAVALGMAKDAADAFIDEFFPDTTTVLASRWEKSLKLATVTTDSIETRRARLVARLRKINGPRISQLEQMLSGPLALDPSDMVWSEQLRSDIEERMTQSTGVVALSVPTAAPGRIVIFGQNRTGVVEDTGVQIYIALSSVGVTVATLTHPDGTVWTIPVNATTGWYFTRTVFTGKAATGPWYLTIRDSSAPTLTEARLLVSNIVDSGAIYNFYVLRDPALPGTADLIEAQRLFHRTALANMKSAVVETFNFKCDDTYSRCDRDPLGV